jgi:hypothetical protein
MRLGSRRGRTQSLKGSECEGSEHWKRIGGVSIFLTTVLLRAISTFQKQDNRITHDRKNDDEMSRNEICTFLDRVELLEVVSEVVRIDFGVLTQVSCE